MVYLTISTGVGGGVIIDNRLFRGANGNAGEIGHMSVAYDGRRCLCGNTGCLEAYCSGTSLAARAREAVEAGGASSLGKVRPITGLAVVEAVRAGDALAVELWEETMLILGVGVVNVIHLYNPRRVILGGGLTGADELLFEPVRRYAFAHALKTMSAIVDIVPAELGDAVGILGAAAVAVEGLTSL
jgi:glucokinase